MSAKAWLQLFRAPNLFTVPGDPLAGFLIATGGVLDARVVPAVIASMCLYSAGLAMNDVIDYKEDLAERPSRPLPSGAISRTAALTAILGLCVAGIATLHAGLGARSAVMGVALLLTIWLYNFTTKRLPIVGPLTMGTCRGLSLLMGAVAGIGPDLRWLNVGLTLPDSMSFLVPYFYFQSHSMGSWYFNKAFLAGIASMLYIAAVTNLARHETKPVIPKLAKMLPLAAIFAGYLIVKMFTGRILMDPAPTLWLVAVVLCVIQTGDVLKQPAQMLPRAIGGYIRLLLVMQAALCVMPDNVGGSFPKTPASLLCAFGLLAMVPLSAWAGRKFYAS